MRCKICLIFEFVFVCFLGGRILFDEKLVGSRTDDDGYKWLELKWSTKMFRSDNGSTVLCRLGDSSVEGEVFVQGELEFSEYFDIEVKRN